jgi:hypothetical protein
MPSHARWSSNWWQGGGGRNAPCERGGKDDNDHDNEKYGDAGSSRDHTVGG